MNPPPRGVLLGMGMINRCVLAGTIGLLALNSIVFVAAAWTLTRFPFQLDYGEGIVLWQADRVLHLQEAYHPITEYPYIVFHYPPLYHLMSRVVGIVVPSPLASGRILSWVCALGIALGVGLIVRLGIPRKRWSILGALIGALFVFHLPNIDWVPYMRVDVTAIFFALAGVFIFLRHPASWGLPAASVAFVAAIFTKQTMIAAPAAVFLALLLTKRRREALWMMAICVALGGGVAAFLIVATRGEFLRHTALYEANPFSIEQLLQYAKSNLVGLNALAGLAFALPLTILNNRDFYRIREKRDQATTAHFVMVLYFITSFLVSLTAGKLGAYNNYFLEWNIVCCILAGFFLGRVLGPHWHRSATTIAIVLVVAVFAFARLGETHHQWDILTGRDKRLEDLRTNASRALDVVRRTPGPVLSDDMTLLSIAGKEVAWEPAIVTVLADQGIWNEAPALEMIKSQRFALIVGQYLKVSLVYSPTIQTMIDNRYVDSGLGSRQYTILVPRAFDPAVQPNVQR